MKTALWVVVAALSVLVTPKPSEAQSPQNAAFECGLAIGLQGASHDLGKDVFEYFQREPSDEGYRTVLAQQHMRMVHLKYTLGLTINQVRSPHMRSLLEAIEKDVNETIGLLASTVLLQTRAAYFQQLYGLRQISSKIQALGGTVCPNSF